MLNNNSLCLLLFKDMSNRSCFNFLAIVMLIEKNRYSKPLTIRPSLDQKKIGLNNGVVSLSSYNVQLENWSKNMWF